MPKALTLILGAMPSEVTSIVPALSSRSDTRETFQIPHDLRILNEVFRCGDGSYARENAYFRAHDIVEEIEARPEPERAVLLMRVEELRRLYGELSAHYQSLKGESEIPLS